MATVFFVSVKGVLGVSLAAVAYGLVLWISYHKDQPLIPFGEGRKMGQRMVMGGRGGVEPKEADT